MVARSRITTKAAAAGRRMAANPRGISRTGGWTGPDEPAVAAVSGTWAVLCLRRRFRPRRCRLDSCRQQRSRNCGRSGWVRGVLHRRVRRVWCRDRSGAVAQCRAEGLRHLIGTRPRRMGTRCQAAHSRSRMLKIFAKPSTMLVVLKIPQQPDGGSTSVPMISARLRLGSRGCGSKVYLSGGVKLRFNPWFAISMSSRQPNLSKLWRERLVAIGQARRIGDVAFLSRRLVNAAAAVNS